MRTYTILLFLSFIGFIRLDGQSVNQLDEQSNILITNQTASITNLQNSRSVSSGYYGSCMPDIKHLNSAWGKWEATTSGEVTMSILPFDMTDDIDFVIFKLEEKTNNLIEVRCSASGPIINKPKSSFNCSGETGLRETSNKVSSNAGCYNINNNFLEKIDVLENEIYFIHVINFGSYNGFDITIIMDEALNIDHPSNTESIAWNIYPNPTVSDIKIVLSEDLRAISREIRIFDSYGRHIKSNKILKGDSGQINLDLHPLSTGVYNIILYTENDIYTKKIIKL